MSTTDGWIFFCLTTAWMLHPQEPASHALASAPTRPAHRRIASKEQQIPIALKKPDPRPEEGQEWVAVVPKEPRPAQEETGLRPGCRF